MFKGTDISICSGQRQDTKIDPSALYRWHLFAFTTFCDFFFLSAALTWAILVPGLSRACCQFFFQVVMVVWNRQIFTRSQDENVWLILSWNLMQSLHLVLQSWRTHMLSMSCHEPVNHKYLKVNGSQMWTCTKNRC